MGSLKGEAYLFKKKLKTNVTFATFMLRGQIQTKNLFKMTFCILHLNHCSYRGNIKERVDYIQISRSYTCILYTDKYKVMHLGRNNPNSASRKKRCSEVNITFNSIEFQ